MDDNGIGIGLGLQMSKSGAGGYRPIVFRWDFFNLSAMYFFNWPKVIL